MGILRTLLLLAVMIVPARAEDTSISSPDRAAIRSVIERQIAAFAKDDATAAFAFASAAIQRQFGSPDVFMRMVQNGYAAVYRPRSVQFGETRLVNGIVVQQVDVIGPDGIGAHAFYLMEHAGDGQWRINGVTLTPGGENET